jgi:uncharacterized protein YndB with AHSA1/START domain
MTPTSRISIETVVRAPPADAWKAYTAPEAIMQWNQASPEWHCPSASVDLREGGRHIARMEARDGSFGFDFTATYEEVDEPRALTLLLDDGRRARTTFEAHGDGARVRTEFDADATHSIDQQRDGWQAILDSFAAHVERTMAGR